MARNSSIPDLGHANAVREQARLLNKAIEAAVLDADLIVTVKVEKQPGRANPLLGYSVLVDVSVPLVRDNINEEQQRTLQEIYGARA